jgi:hypothetical protein
MNLKIINYHHPNGICGNLLNAIECLANRKKNELIYFKFNNLLYSNKFNVWEKFFYQPFNEYEDLILKKIKNNNYTNETFAHYNYNNFVFNYNFKNNLKIYYDKIAVDPLRKIVKKFIKFKSIVLFRAKEFENKNFQTQNLGIHIRGTDKFSSKGHDKFKNKRNLLSFQNHIKLIVKQKMKISNSKKIFLATDEKNYYNKMKYFFGKNLLKMNTKILSSEQDTGTHFINVYGTESWKTQLGTEALTDAILLSKCKYSLLSQSNLSLASILLRDDYNFEFLDAHIQR